MHWRDFWSAGAQRSIRIERRMNAARKFPREASLCILNLEWDLIMIKRIESCTQKCCVSFCHSECFLDGLSMQLGEFTLTLMLCHVRFSNHVTYGAVSKGESAVFVLHSFPEQWNIELLACLQHVWLWCCYVPQSSAINLVSTMLL